MLTTHQRFPEIDLIRGFALLGIFLVNIDSMSNSWLFNNFQFVIHNSFDDIWHQLNLVFLQQRFIGIFSLLFGLSIAIQQQKFKEMGMTFIPYCLKRSAIFILIGFLHVLFFWMGDIILIYGLFSLLLMLFFNLPNSVLLLSSMLIFFLPTILYMLNLIPSHFGGEIENQYSYSSIIETYQSGSLYEMMRARLTEYHYLNLNIIIWFKQSFALIILGYLIGRNNLHNLWRQYWNKLRWILLFGLLSSIIFALYFFLTLDPMNFWLRLIYDLHIIISITTYVLLILLIYKSDIFPRIVSLIINLGRMSMSNYLLQSIICAFIFTNYGFGLFSETSPTQNVIIVFCVYTFQIILSYFYLRKFKTGPLEMLWHKFAYPKKHQTLQ